MSLHLNRCYSCTWYERLQKKSLLLLNTIVHKKHIEKKLYGDLYSIFLIIVRFHLVTYRLTVVQQFELSKF
jgi:hypothetical protein